MTPDSRDLIATDPEILHGQAHVRGTRVPVSVVLDCVAAGMTEREILDEYPTLTLEGIRAAAGYGAELAREEVRPLPSAS
ncbi:MAG TPA: DUF433 domain-containing protein [Actinomycetota bacterium]|nr:DUF433 domain-containing protein [Actinomycetota bacterium]